MKIFFPTFFAILAAAAVIWGVFIYQQEQEREASTRLSILTNLAEQARLRYDNFSLVKEIRPDSSTNSSLGTPRDFYEFSKKRLPRDANLTSLKFDFAFRYRQAIALAREKGSYSPEILAWADQMEKELNQFFPQN